MQFLWDRSDLVVAWAVGITITAAALIETFRPFRNLASSTLRRWLANGALYLSSNIILALVYRASGIGLALAMQSSGRGFLNSANVPFALRFALGLLLIDFLSYATHRLNHSLPFLWRFHRVHHSETDLDVTTGIRFHPVEGLFTYGAPLAAIALLGIPPSAVLTAYLALIVQDSFTHANVRIPAWMDRALRTILITPDLHRRHHSSDQSDQNTNFGTVFSFWDRLFATFHYRDSAEIAVYGLSEIPEGSSFNVIHLLALPFRSMTNSVRSSESRELNAARQVDR